MWYICLYIDLYMYFCTVSNLKIQKLVRKKTRDIKFCKNCDLVNEKTCDVKLLSANFSQDAPEKQIF